MPAVNAVLDRLAETNTRLEAVKRLTALANEHRERLLGIADRPGSRNGITYEFVRSVNQLGSSGRRDRPSIQEQVRSLATELAGEVRSLLAAFPEARACWNGINPDELWRHRRRRVAVEATRGVTDVPR